METELLELRFEFRQGVYSPINALCEDYETDPRAPKSPTRCRWYSFHGCSSPNRVNEENPSCEITDLRRKLDPFQR